MSWLARSIANSLNLDEPGDNDAISNPNPNPNAADSNSPSSSVREELSELTETVTRQFWGVASFLAPPPDHQIASKSSSPKNQQPSDQEEEESNGEDMIAGMRNDFAEIGGRFKSGISKISSNVNVSEITKMASNFLQTRSRNDFNDEYLIGSPVGVTEEVVAFARGIAAHPETWLDFPVPDDDAFDDFDMSDAQQEHVMAVESLAPRLAALRIELCLGYMSEGCFWKIYFALLHPRLSKQDAELLSTPHVVEARAMLSGGLKSQARPTKPVWSDIGSNISKEFADLPHEESLSVPSHPESESAPLNTSTGEVIPSIVASKTIGNEAAASVVPNESETEKHLVQRTEMQIIDKVMVEEKPVYQAKQYVSSSTSNVSDEKYEDDADDWLKEESSEMVKTNGATILIENDEDISFSDLEEDVEEIPISYKKVTLGLDTSSKEPQY